MTIRPSPLTVASGISWQHMPLETVAAVVVVLGPAPEPFKTVTVYAARAQQ